MSTQAKRPSAWRWFDALTFGVPSLVVTCLTLYVTLGSSTLGTQEYALMWVCSAAFWAIYGALVWSRYRFIQRYDMVLSTGTMVRTNGFRASRADFEAEIRRVLLLWSPYVMDAQSLLERHRIWVTFEAEPLKKLRFTRNQPRTFAGLTRAGGEAVKISYFEDPDKPLETTAFAHELGHIILGRSTDSWSNDEHHEFMKLHKLP